MVGPTANFGELAERQDRARVAAPGEFLDGAADTPLELAQRGGRRDVAAAGVDGQEKVEGLAHRRPVHLAGPELHAGEELEQGQLAVRVRG